MCILNCLLHVHHNNASRRKSTVFASVVIRFMVPLTFQSSDLQTLTVFFYYCCGWSSFSLILEAGFCIEATVLNCISLELTHIVQICSGFLSTDVFLSTHLLTEIRSLLRVVQMLNRRQGSTNSMIKNDSTAQL